MASLHDCLFDGYCDYVDQIELEYQQTEEYQNIRRRLDEYETAIGSQDTDSETRKQLMREWSDLELELRAKYEALIIKAFMKLILPN